MGKRENGKAIQQLGVFRDTISGLYETTKALYQEVDFTEFEPTHQTETFYTPQSEEDIAVLYQDLVKYGYIAPDTGLKTFVGIFNKKTFSKPVEWIKTQRQLSFFVYQAFYNSTRRICG